jgi:hypothetical protein
LNAFEGDGAATGGSWSRFAIRSKFKSYVFAQESVQSGRGPLIFVIFHRFAQAFRQTFPLNLRKTHFVSVGIDETSFPPLVILSAAEDLILPFESTLSSGAGSSALDAPQNDRRES